ncbi:ABC transporter ATP-binding component [Corynebacterium suranareeae]|uniref:Fatty acid ABC transporter ATP-binding/permease protein n=1 Tax=Corynebacterium suranareeae TaxID=2506452 RepID=A0A160PN68_9CORY|nr:ABC transporter ATP-binding protein [Corynebacterium suranareeae]BAU95347.1 ABC transporter ATP-binding component [Corynebacterium suranareeae]
MSDNAGRKDAAPHQKAQNFGPSAKRLFGILGHDRTTLIVVIFLAILSVGLTVLGPWLLGKATNVVFEGFLSKRMPAGASKEDIIAQLQAAGENNQASMMQDMNLVPGSGIDFDKLGLILGLVIGAYVIGSVLSLIQARMLNRIVQSAMHRLRMEVEEKVHRLPLSYFDSIKRGDLLSRVTNDVDNIGQSLQQTLSQAITSLLTVIGVLVMMFIISPLLALVALITIPITIVVTVLVAKRSQKLFAQQWKQTGVLNARVEETYSGHAVVKVFGHQKDVQKAFEEENQAVYKASFGAQFVSGIIMPTMMFVGNLSYVAIAVVGGLQVASGSLSIGAVQSFIQYSRQFTQPLSQLGSMANLLQSGVASAERVFELLDEKDQDNDPAQANTVAFGANRLEFKDVSFGYTPELPLINNLDLEVRSGSTIAIVGPTGAGKTTLVNLIMRFYDINSGSITLGETADNAIDIRTMTRKNLRSRTGMVLQDTWLFAGTIRDNILYGRPEATEEEMLAASKAAYVDRFVRSLPDGYDTVLDDEAMNLSVGERQLITIARAFLANPRLLILDEATSSVDTRTELFIQRAMTKLRQDRTAFVIAHRLSTIRDANLILMMKDGEIVEQGNHRELMALEGEYWKLYNSQFDAPIKGESGS